MSRNESFWGSPEEDESVATLIGLAKNDWTDIGALIGEIGRRCGAYIPPREAATVLGELAGVLIDNDVVPGDLGSDPDFRPWPGTRQERVSRIVREMIELNRMPWPSEIAWFSYVPRHDEQMTSGRKASL